MSKLEKTNDKSIVKSSLNKYIMKTYIHMRPNNYKGQSISNEKLKALQQLRANRKIRITKSDKINKVVIWSECEYSQEALRQLNISTYEPITLEEHKRIVENVHNSNIKKIVFFTKNDQ
ncbi:hypothetical protein GJ496_000025 [Pomphorhynchus laevis]|nr:hypothetical protein GJ496_000025 [Pomphorhynchus laevis]